MSRTRDRALVHKPGKEALDVRPAQPSGVAQFMKADEGPNLVNAGLLGALAVVQVTDTLAHWSSTLTERSAGSAWRGACAAADKAACCGRILGTGGSAMRTSKPSGSGSAESSKAGNRDAPLLTFC